MCHSNQCSSTATIRSTISIRPTSPEIAVLALIALMLFAFIKIAEFFLVIYASVKAANGEYYQYPFCIPFIKGIELPAAEIHEDEHAVEPQP
jgi:uncharacterized Tic20 family protein